MASVMLELTGEAATRKAGQALGELLLSEPVGKQAFALALIGELGAGKTTFVRGLAKGLGIREKITSPSFLIAKCYAVPSLRAKRSNPMRSIAPSDSEGSRGIRDEILRPPIGGLLAMTGRRHLWHFDFYRLEHPNKRDLELLDFQKILRDPANIVAVEWAERVAHALLQPTTRFRFEVVREGMRRLTIHEGTNLKIQNSKVKIAT